VGRLDTVQADISIIKAATKTAGLYYRCKLPAVRQWLHFLLILAALAMFFGGYAVVELRRYPLPPTTAAGIYVAMLLLLALYLAPGFPAPREFFSRRIRGLRGLSMLFAAFVLPYAIYSAATGDFHSGAFIRLTALAAVSFGTFTFFPVRRPDRLNWQDALVLLSLFVPVVFGRIGGIWNVPVNLDFMTRVYLVATGAWSFVVIRGIKGAGYEFRLSWVLLYDALISLVCFTAIGLPVGFALRFLGWHPRWRGITAFAADYVTIFLFIAVAEELFFRGLLQNLLEPSLGSRYWAQALASALFGLTHIRHAPAPNWRYVILATIAGWFYGWAYRKHRNLMASATTHAFVDTIWRTWLTLP